MPALGVSLRDLLPPAGPREALPVQAVLDLGRRADQLGYDSLWLPEGRGREDFSQLGALAIATRRIRLATGIMPVFSRPPALMALGLATLDDLSGGRAPDTLESPRAASASHLAILFERSGNASRSSG